MICLHLWSTGDNNNYDTYDGPRYDTVKWVYDPSFMHISEPFGDNMTTRKTHSSTQLTIQDLNSYHI